MRLKTCWCHKDGGGKKSDHARRRSNSNPEGLKKNNQAYKGKKNPLGEDGKPLKCFKCQSEYHLAPKCDQKNSGKKDEDARMLSEGSEVSRICVGIDNEFIQCDKEIAGQAGMEFVMVTEREEQLCLLVDDVKYT